MNTSVSSDPSDLSFPSSLPACLAPSPPAPALIIRLTIIQALFFLHHHSPSLTLRVSAPLPGPPPRRSPSHPSLPYHYYEPSGPDECSMYLSHERSRRGSHHRFLTEKAVFADWARTLDIHFHRPDWEPAAAANGSRAPAPGWIPGSNPETGERTSGAVGRVKARDGSRGSSWQGGVAA